MAAAALLKLKARARPLMAKKQTRRAGARHHAPRRGETLAPSACWAVVSYQSGPTSQRPAAGFYLETIAPGQAAAQDALNTWKGSPEVYHSGFVVHVEGACRPGAKRDVWLLRRDENGNRKYRLLLTHEPPQEEDGWQGICLEKGRVIH